MQFLSDDGNRILWPFDGPLHIGKDFFTQDSSGFIHQTDKSHMLYDLISTEDVPGFRGRFLEYNCHQLTKSSITFVCECVENYSTVDGINVRMI